MVQELTGTTMSHSIESLGTGQEHGRSPQASTTARWLPMRSLDNSHRTEVCKHLLALSPADRLLRFAHAATDEQIEHYCAQIDFLHDELFGVFDRRLRLVAMAHLAFAPGGLTAEFGVSVLGRVRGRGFGTRLFEHAVMHARNRGVSTMVLYVARDNAAMLAIVRRAGAQVSIDGAEATARLPLVSDTLGSRVEALLERHAAEFDYQLKLRVFRLDQLWQGGLSASRLDD